MKGPGTRARLRTALGAAMLVAPLVCACDGPADTTGAGPTGGPGAGSIGTSTTGEAYELTPDTSGLVVTDGEYESAQSGAPDFLNRPLAVYLAGGQGAPGEAWVQTKSGGGLHDATVEAPETPGAPLRLTVNNVWEDESDGWVLQHAVLSLTAADHDGDGQADGVEGTMSGASLCDAGDSTCGGFSFEVPVAGQRIESPAKVSVAWKGAWPDRRVTVSSSRPIPTANLQAAIVHRIDGKDAPFTLAGEAGESGSGSAWTVQSVSPYELEQSASIEIGAATDLAGLTTEAVAINKTTFVPPSTTTIDGAWDFSGGSPFVGATGSQVVPSFGTIQAPTGGAMAMLPIISNETQVTAWSVAVRPPTGATTLQIRVAVAYEAEPNLVDGFAAAFGTAAAAVSAPIPWSGTSTPVEALGTTWNVTDFQTVSVDVGDFAGHTGVLRLGTTDPNPSPMLPLGFGGPAMFLVDRISTSGDAAP